MRVGIATDHGGFNLKEEVASHLRAAGHEVVDFGAYALNPDDDYPDKPARRCRGYGSGATFGFEPDRVVLVAKELLGRG